MKKDISPLYIISRNFVEFGAFTELEIAGFRQRGIVTDHDYVRSAEGHDWLPLDRWMTHIEPKPAAKTKVPAARKRGASSAKASKKAA